MHGFRSVFRVIEADLNARRTDYTIGEIHELALGSITPAILDPLEQNVLAEMSHVNFSKAGSESADGPIGLGHYYRQISDFTISLYAADPSHLLRVDTFGDGFLFIARFRDDYLRRRLFIRSKIKSSVLHPTIMKSRWLDELSESTLNGFVDIDLLALDDVHSYINDFTFMPDMFGNMIIYYSNINEDGSPAGFNGDFTGGGGSGGTDFDNDPRFNIPPACKG